MSVERILRLGQNDWLSGDVISWSLQPAPLPGCGVRATGGNRAWGVGESPPSLPLPTASALSLWALKNGVRASLGCSLPTVLSLNPLG